MQDVSEFNISFVKLVEAHPCLYDTTTDDYYRGHVQDQAWSSIARTIGPTVTVKECKARWRNLRGRFTKHLKSYASADPVENNKRPYYLAEHLEFLLPFTKSKKLGEEDDTPFEDHISRFLEIDSSISDNPVEGEELGAHEAIEYKYQRAQSETDRNDRLGHDRHEPHRDVERPNKRMAPYGSDPIPMHEKYRRLSSSGQRKYAEHDDGSRSHRANDIVDYKDSDVLFLMSLLPDLKRMNDVQKRNYKIGILSLGGEILNEHSTQPNSISAAAVQRLIRRNSSYMSPDSGMPRSQRKGVQTSENEESTENSTSN
ncbi:AAEL009056-PA [Aedes aegypti]|uniref:AAEL009056-PA n=2 Tax=Aedes aegypti TaxID=7159 RepID=A0A1S4FLD2_AEDAE|nr:uncharacterized protein LOC5571426 [Aedes aegypti]EAT39109.1 AAEL009056-PA [Aedes aegypti]